MSFTLEEIDEFKTEARELLETAEKSLLTLDKDDNFYSAFDLIFRCFHNLKGASGMMEFTDLQAFIHEIETLWMQFKDKPSVPREHVSMFLRGIDAARFILDGDKVDFDFTVVSSRPMAVAPEIQKQSSIEPTPQSTSNISLDPSMGEFIAECDEIVDRVSNALQLIEAKNHKKEDLEALYRDIHSLKGAAYLFSYNSIGDIAHLMESSLEGVRDGKQKPTAELLDALFSCLVIIEEQLKLLKATGKTGDTKSFLPDLAKGLNPKTTENNIKTESSNHPMKNESSAAKLDSAQAQLIEKDQEANSSIRVSVSLLDNLMTLMGEMVLVRNQVLQFSSQSDDLEFLNLSKRLNVVTSEIQGEMMKTRMQPIGNILGKFNRVVRDLSHELKKEISLNILGADTELDKSLIESIKDPLTHIVRNSCDHGIEAIEMREAAGKPRAGTISIRSYHEGGQVVIEVKDDGKGLHKDFLIKKAIEKGIITQAQSSTLGEKDIFNLIFAPGFSTAASVTNVSGRGVGMDVVRTNVERIGGSVDLHSVAGKGTTIKIKIPLTLAIVPALIIKCNDETFAIPQVKLEELVRVDQSSSENKIEFLHGTPVYRLRGNILPLVSLNKILGFKEPSTDTLGAKNIAVLNADHCSFGLIVDEVQDTADIVVKPINRLLRSLQVYSGATILGDGSIALILDVLGISKVAQIGNESVKSEERSALRNDDRIKSEQQEFLIVRLNAKAKHAIVLNDVKRLEEFKVSHVEYSGTKRVIRYGDSILPLLSASELLGYGVHPDTKSRETVSVVVIQKAGAVYGLEVEEIVDTLSTNVDVDTTLVAQEGFFGNLNTPEELIVAIDAFGLIRKAFPDTEIKQKSALVHNLVTARVYNQEVAAGSPAAELLQKNLNILLVEDTLFFRKAIAEVLKKAGHEITFAVDGKDAIDILEQNPKKFDMIVSDIEMPRMNGFELAKAVRANPALSRLPMLAISSKCDQNTSSKGLQSGFNMYLEKLQPQILLDSVSALSIEARRTA
jgi:two-component system, chemotaxis family, sensor kinase CheA